MSSKSITRLGKSKQRSEVSPRTKKTNQEGKATSLHSKHLFAQAGLNPHYLLGQVKQGQCELGWEQAWGTGTDPTFAGSSERGFQGREQGGSSSSEFICSLPGARRKGDYTTEWGTQQSIPSSSTKRRDTPGPNHPPALRVLFYPLSLLSTWFLILKGLNCGILPPQSVPSPASPTREWSDANIHLFLCAKN